MEESEHRFSDRATAGRQLADALARFAAESPVILGLPRGGIPVAAQVAHALEAPLDILMVRKMGTPLAPAIAIGALAEGGVQVLDTVMCEQIGIELDDIPRMVRDHARDIDRRTIELQRHHRRLDLRGRLVIIVDDCLVTGSTAHAAIRSARRSGAACVILAVPVGTREALRRLGEVADEIVCLEVPTQDTSVSTFYGTFPQVSDVEVFSALGVSIESRSCASNSGRTIEDIVLDVGSVHLPARLTLVEGASLLVIFAHSSGHGRHSPRNRESAELLHHAGVSTLLLDLLTEGEAVDRRNAFDIHGLADRLMTAVDWAGSSPRTAHLGVAIFGASTGAAAALEVAARRPDVVRSVVSRGGRPDLAEAWLDLVRCPTLLIVGGDDVEVLRLNYVAGQHLLCPSALEIVPGATHLFAEPGALQSAAAAARDWFMDTSVTRVA